MQRSRWRRAGLCVLASFGMATGARSACLTAHAEGVELVGVIDTLRGGLKGLILRPDAPVCLSGPQPADTVPETGAIHVYAGSDAVMDQLMATIRRPVRVKGRLFPPTNRLHKASIVMEVSDVLPGP